MATENRKEINYTIKHCKTIMLKVLKAFYISIEKNYMKYCFILRVNYTNLIT